MSEYQPPYYGGAPYGHNQNHNQSQNQLNGHQQQAQAHQFPQQPYQAQSPFYPPQNTGRASQVPMSQQHYGQAMSAFDYNQSIPGFSASTVASGVPPLPIFQNWNQENYQIPQPTPQYPSQQNSVAYQGYNNTPPVQNQYYPPNPAVQSQRPFHVQPTASTVVNRDSSEGEFDEQTGHGYGPPGRNTNHYRGNDGNGFIDTAHRAVFAKSQDASPLQTGSGNSSSISRAPSQPRPQPASGPSFYSSYVSPSEPQMNNGAHVPPAPLTLPKKPADTFQTANEPAQAPAAAVPYSQPVVNANGKPAPSRAEAPTGKENSFPVPLPVVEDTGLSHFRDVPKDVARKAAEGAVWEMWPYDVRLPTWVADGIAQDVIIDIFDALKLPKTASRTPRGPSISQHIQSSKDGSGQEEGELPASPNPDTDIQSSKPTSGEGELPTGEKKHQRSATIDLAPTSPAAFTLISAPNVKSAAALEKEKTLQLKMDKLRKSREARQQKTEAAKIAKPDSLPTKPDLPAKPASLPAKPASLAAIPALPSLPQRSTAEVATPTANLPAGTSAIVSAHLPATAQAQAVVEVQASSPKRAAVPRGPSIPGLFLANPSLPTVPSATIVASATTMPSATTQPFAATNMQSSAPTRKRPVAADFTTSNTPFKRPFGQPPSSERFIINVSEDDDSDAMSIDSPGTSPAQPTRRSFHSQPPLTDTRPNPYSPSQSTSAMDTLATASQLSRKGSVQPGELQKKESEIDALARKIREAEARKLLRSASGTQTPLIREENSLPNKAEVIDMQNAVLVAETQMAIDHKRIAEQKAAEERADERRKKAEDKRQRRSQIGSILPNIDAEAQRHQARLDELRAEMAEVEAAIQKNLSNKQLLAEEMDMLAEEQDDEINAQKQKLDTLTREEAAAVPLPSSPTRSVETAHAPIDASASASTPEPRSPSVPMDLDKSSPEVESEVFMEQPSGDRVAVAEQSIPAVSNGFTSRDQPEAERSDEASLETNSGVVAVDEAAVNGVLEAALQEAVRAQAEETQVEEGQVEEGQVEKGQVEEGQVDEGQVDEGQINEPSDKEPQPDGKAQPSVYSPTMHNGESPSAGVAEREPKRGTEVDVESDHYEPPDATPIVESPPFSPAPPGKVETPEEGAIADSPEEGEAVDSPQESIPSPEPSHDVQVEVKESRSTNGSGPPIENGVQDDPDEAQYFTPYESPLHHFKAYRFHPEYLEKIAGGLKSLTYTHKIDPNKELCRFELAGGVCNDNTCDLQHFRQIGLPDDAVLTALGSPDEFPREQRERFIEGLKGVLSSLRVRRVNNFAEIASEIVAHRRSFLGDPSKVLMLEGTDV